jgi:hypothetical protein
MFVTVPAAKPIRVQSPAAVGNVIQGPFAKAPGYLCRSTGRELENNVREATRNRWLFRVFVLLVRILAVRIGKGHLINNLEITRSVATHIFGKSCQSRLDALLPPFLHQKDEYPEKKYMARKLAIVTRASCCRTTTR